MTDLSRLVVVGDSISAGVQNISLLGTQQPNGYASLVAAQAGVPLILPLIAYPGLPNVLELTFNGSLDFIQAVPGPPPAKPRVNPNVQPTNLAVPGFSVAAALAPPSVLPPPLNGWASAVLESPAYPNTPISQLQEAMALKPTTVILWLGSDDALVPALVGQVSLLTPPAAFTAAFSAVIGSLAQTGATLIVANIPDITEIAFFTPITRIAQTSGLSAAAVAAALGTGTGDYVGMGALAQALEILVGTARGPLPTICQAPYAGLPSTTTPCVLTATDAATIRTTIGSYNAAIAAAVAGLPRATLVDIHSLVDQLSSNGYNVLGRTLNTGLLGGLFTLDGIHPTNTGYAIIGNTFIETMNANLRTRIPAVDVNKIAKHDPLVFGLGPL